MVTEALFLLFILGAVNHQVTYILTSSVLFAGFREGIATLFGPQSKVAYLVKCHLCAGTWIGLVEGLLVAQHLVIVGDIITDWLLVSFSAALIGRAINEVMAWAAGQVYAHEWQQRRTEFLAAREDAFLEGIVEGPHSEHTHDFIRADFDDPGFIEVAPDEYQKVA